MSPSPPMLIPNAEGFMYVAGAIGNCLQVASGADYTVDIVVSGNVVGAVAAGLTLNYSGIVVGQDVSQSLMNQGSPDMAGSAVVGGDPVPDPDGTHHVVISNDGAAKGEAGASGSGNLIRFTMAAPTSASPAPYTH